MNASARTLTMLNSMKKSSRSLYFLNVRYSSSVNKNPVADIECEEVKIPVPWGHLSCLRWGPTDKQPIVALHGWQDNSGTWKPLIPHLPPNTPILAVDSPGHGHSSWYPPGMSYNSSDNPIILRRIVSHFGWKSVSLLGHSMGATTSFVYSSLFPDQVNFIIQLDILKPTTGRSKNFVDKWSNAVDIYLKADARNIDGGEPPSYTLEELIEKLHSGTYKSINRESAKYLLERAISKSSSDPNKYYFKRDSRMKRNFELGTNTKDMRAFAERIKCPMLHIKFKSGPYFEPEEEYMEILNVLKESKKNFEAIIVPGTHHSHLNNPELIAPHINKFLQKYYNNN